MGKKLMVRMLCIAFVVTGIFAGKQTALADAAAKEDTSYDKYISFGADLSQKERKAVLEGFGITEEEVADYKTVEVTNEEEHEYLGEYIDASVIGKRALSSVMIIKTEEGSGINVETKNISYCTASMYCNALTTAGLKDAQVTVVGPFNISGTSALVGAMKAYAEMTGETISQETMDTATDELVTTGEVADNIGDKEKAAELIAAVKQKVFSDEMTTEEDIRDAVESSARALAIDLSEDDINNITDMMEKVSKEDIDVDAITEQAKEIYDKLKDSNIDIGNVDTDGLFDKVGSFFANIFQAIVDFFKGLFG